VRRLTVAGMLVAALAAPAGGAMLDERGPTCLACHGEKGQSQTPDTPSLGGQPSDYVVIQLHLFREGQRKVEIMNEMAKGLSDDDLRAFAAMITKLPPPPPSSDAGDPARMERARALIGQHRCNFCHKADFSGQDSIPRIGAQREDYLLKALREYKSNARRGYEPIMAEVLYPITDDQIADLAYFLSRTR